MSFSKRQFLRYRVIDKELSMIPGRRVKSVQIQRILLERYDMKISTRTIQKDIEVMRDDSQLGYFAPIEIDTVVKAFYYTDPNFTINKFKLKEEEINSLEFILSVFRQYSDHGIFQKFVSGLEKVESAIQIEKESRQEREKNWDFIMIEPVVSIKKEVSVLIPKIIGAIDRQNKVQFIYKKFGASSSTMRICTPIWLKEYRGLWYLFAKEEQTKKEKTFALDRMRDLIVLDLIGEKPSIDPQEYYDKTIGVTVLDKPVEKIVLSFDPYQGNYIKTQPLHHSQKILIDTNEELRIMISVIPNYELISIILSYGKSIRVISPKSLKKQVFQNLQEASDLYSGK